MRIVALIILSLFLQNCQAQKMVQSVDDLPKLKENDSVFLNKPLKLLLKEIGPAIKMCLGNPTNTSSEVNTYFSFYFVNRKEFLSNEKLNKRPAHLTIYIKRDEKNPITRPLNKDNSWTQEDEKAYGHLLVSYINPRPSQKINAL